jgi:hypothetical protein
MSFGSFLAFYLADLGWSKQNVGLALTVGGLAAVAAQIPGGALADAVRWKRGLAACGFGLIAVSALILALWPSFLLVFCGRDSPRHERRARRPCDRRDQSRPRRPAWNVVAHRAKLSLRRCRQRRNSRVHGRPRSLPVKQRHIHCCCASSPVSANLENAESWKILVTRVKRIRLPLPSQPEWPCDRMRCSRLRYDVQL